MMTQPSQESVDAYFESRLLSPDDDLSDVLAANLAAGLPAHDVSPLQGQFLQLLMRIHRVRRVLEIGTLGGYSTIWMARALPKGGRVTTLELNPLHARTARRNFEEFGVASRVDLVIGDAQKSLSALADAAVEPFDLVFIDADKANNARYFEGALRLAADHAVVVIDNVVRGGAVSDPSSDDPSVRGVRELVEMIRREEHVSATALQTVGRKGYDGFIIAIVNCAGQSSESSE